MLTVAITGHTVGLGKFVLDFYRDLGFLVTGYSKSTGFDLRNWQALQKFLDVTGNCDIIISNAKPDFAQTILLYEFAKRQNFRPKIISIGSQIINVDVPITQDIGINLYKTQKLALKNAHDQLCGKYPELQSILVHPAHLYDKDGTLHQDIFVWLQKFHKQISSNTTGEINV